MAESLFQPSEIVSVVRAGVTARSPFEPASHLRLTVAGQQVGWIPRRHADVLRRIPGMLGDGPQDAPSRAGRAERRDCPACTTFETRSAALATLARQLADAGHVRGWRNELFAVTPSSPRRRSPWWSAPRHASWGC